jgi:hypothetical protein
VVPANGTAPPPAQQGFAAICAELCNLLFTPKFYVLMGAAKARPARHKPPAST